MKLPQHSLRELFWLITLVAVCIAWWLDRRAILKESTAKTAELAELVNRLEMEVLRRDWGVHQSGWSVPRLPQ
jgi:hypothetical protein